MTIFKLPDLGEGLSDAEILRWHVKVGDTIAVDQPMLSVETAKAVVEVPAPQSGVIKALHGEPGERIETGAPLVEFVSDAPAGAATPAAGSDSGTVVGHMPSGEETEYTTAARAAGVAAAFTRIQAVPAARALARSLGVDLAQVAGTGRDGLITLEDVIAAGLPEGATTRGSTMRLPPIDPDDGDVQQLRSLRRAMAQSMALARDSVMECSVFDDADLHGWPVGTDYTVRVIRAIGVACKVEPGLNAWYDSKAQSRRLFDHVDVGLAVDTPDGLLVPVLRDVGRLSAGQLRSELNRLKVAARERTVTSEELRHFTFMLSNFGMMAGRYATPVVVPPAVAILGTGRVRDDVVAIHGQVAVHKRMPLSLTFDHRVVTGGEAVRFLGALIADLELPR
ncbi:MAG: dihydrolipoamide acetyltransferase family protein [Steroidobacteraceae bacterium]